MTPEQIADRLTRRCGNCQFWQERNGEQGECHRRAPLPLLVLCRDNYEFVVIWPDTNASHWCGEWGPYPKQQVLEVKK